MPTCGNWYFNFFYLKKKNDLIVDMANKIRNGMKFKTFIDILGTSIFLILYLFLSK